MDILQTNEERQDAIVRLELDEIQELDGMMNDTDHKMDPDARGRLEDDMNVLHRIMVILLDGTQVAQEMFGDD